jgi:hypothetical protein
MEEWKPIPDYEGLYLISDCGNVKSLERAGTVGGILKQRQHYKGYIEYVLTKNNESKSHKAHRLVASAWLEDWDAALTVNHKDKIRYNNHVSNLEMLSNHDNIIHGQGIPVYSYSLDGEFIKGYKCIAEAIREGNRNITQVLQGKRRMANKKMWKTFKTKSIEPYNKRKRTW